MVNNPKGDSNPAALKDMEREECELNKKPSLRWARSCTEMATVLDSQDQNKIL